MKPYDICPNCRAQIKQSLMGKNSILNPSYTAIINHFEGSNVEAFCTKCGKEKILKYANRIFNEVEAIRKRVAILIEAMPALNIHAPYEWEYI